MPRLLMFYVQSPYPKLVGCLFSCLRSLQALRPGLVPLDAERHSASQHGFTLEHAVSLYKRLVLVARERWIPTLIRSLSSLGPLAQTRGGGLGTRRAANPPHTS